MPYDTAEFFKRLKSMHKDLVKEDDDLQILVDGLERSGKTTVAMKIGETLRGLDETLNNMVFHEQDFLEFCKKLGDYPDGAVHICDEAQNILSSKRNDRFIKYAEDILKSMGAFHQVMIYCSPRSWELNRVLIERCHLFVHVYGRGYAKAWVGDHAQALLNALIKARKAGELTSFKQIKPILKKKGIKPSIFAEIEFEEMDHDLRDRYNREKRERISDMAQKRANQLEGLLNKGSNGDGEEKEESGESVEKYLSVAQVAERLDYTKDNVYKLIEKGELRSVKLFNRTVRVPESALQEIITIS